MKCIALLLLAAACLLVTTDVATARAVRIWSYEELLDASDMVVIAAPTTNIDTDEHIELPGFKGQRVIGVETRFVVSAFLKHDKTIEQLKPIKDIVVHHYRPAPGGVMVPNGPGFVHFALPENPPLIPGTFVARTYILFLRREADGRYAPVVGQTDPGIAVKEVEGVYGSAVTETQTKLGIDIANVLKECKTIKPGMTRAELSKVFETEGGLSSATHRTFVYHDCPYVKVDVEFSASDPKQEKETDTIVKISKPYLDWGNRD